MNKQPIKTEPINNLKFQKWLMWVEEIRQDTETMLLNRAIYNRYLEIIKTNKDIRQPSDFHEWTVRNYGSYIVMAIRRQLDSDKDVISLKRLLMELGQNPQLLTKKWFRTLYSDIPGNFPLPAESFADGDFEKFAGNLEYFDPSVAIIDLKKLDILGKNITRYANKQIAHRTKVKSPLTFSEINNFFTEFETLVKKYILLFTASGYDSLTPVFQYDWEEIFTKIWIKKNT